MIYTLEKRTGRDMGGLTSWYELRQYSGRSKLGILLEGQTVEDFDTLKEAKAFCKQNEIEYIMASTPKGCRW